MGKQRPKLNYGPRIGRPLVHSEPTYFYRRVLDPSIEIINNATRGIRGKAVRRIVDNFSLTMIYPFKVRALRERSGLLHPPSVSAMAASLGRTSLASLREPVTATIEGVELFSGIVGIVVSYPEFETEQHALQSELRKLLGFGPEVKTRIGPGTPHVGIGIAVGNVAAGAMKQIESRLPDILELGVVQNIHGPI